MAPADHRLLPLRLRRRSSSARFVVVNGGFAVYEVRNELWRRRRTKRRARTCLRGRRHRILRAYQIFIVFFCSRPPIFTTNCNKNHKFAPSIAFAAAIDLKTNEISAFLLPTGFARHSACKRESVDEPTSPSRSRKSSYLYTRRRTSRRTSK